MATIEIAHFYNKHHLSNHYYQIIRREKKKQTHIERDTIERDR